MSILEGIIGRAKPTWIESGKRWSSHLRPSWSTRWKREFLGREGTLLQKWEEDSRFRWWGTEICLQLSSWSLHGHGDRDQTVWRDEKARLLHHAQRGKQAALHHRGQAHWRHLVTTSVGAGPAYEAAALHLHLKSTASCQRCNHRLPRLVFYQVQSQQWAKRGASNRSEWIIPGALRK